MSEGAAFEYMEKLVRNAMRKLYSAAEKDSRIREAIAKDEITVEVLLALMEPEK